MVCKFCYHIKINSSYSKYTIYLFGKGLEGNPFIIRFKTGYKVWHLYTGTSLEGNPFIIRFKTQDMLLKENPILDCLEGNPFIIRFKTKTYFKSNIVLFFSSLEGNPFIIRFKTSIC